jgi:hypothetical protein
MHDMTSAQITSSTRTVQAKSKTYTYRDIIVILEKAEYKITFNTSQGYIDVLKTRNGKRHATQKMPKTFWSWQEVESNYKLLAPVITEVQRHALELAA